MLLLFCCESETCCFFAVKANADERTCLPTFAPAGKTYQARQGVCTNARAPCSNSCENTSGLARSLVDAAVLLVPTLSKPHQVMTCTSSTNIAMKFTMPLWPASV